MTTLGERTHVATWAAAALLVLQACASHVQGGRTALPAAEAPSCSTRAPGWRAEGESLRELLVAVAVDGGTTRDWEFHGPERLRRVTTQWNLLGLPIRLAPTTNLASADIRVVVLRSLPVDSATPPSYARYRAGLTRLTLDEQGMIVRAHVAVAERAVDGSPYSSDDQVATLLHEIGHALGLPHSSSPMALMASRPVVTALTRTDVEMARRAYARACSGSRG